MSNNNKRTKRTKRPNRSRTRPRNNVLDYNRLESSRIPRNLMYNSPFPPERTVKLLYFEPNVNFQPGAVAFGVRDWRMNSAYDPDPLVGGGSLAGFAQMAAIYNIYQVVRFRFRFEIISQEAAQPLIIGFTMKDYQPSTTLTTYAACQDAMELAPTTGPHTLSIATAGMPLYRSRWYSIHPGAVVGNMLLYMSTAAYSSVINTNPSSIVWCSLIVLAESSGGSILSGVQMSMYIEYTTKFYSQSSTLV